MPRYFLYIDNGTDLLHDPHGQEFDDVPAAHEEATRAARDLMAESLRCGRPIGMHRTVIIADENGIVQGEVAFKSAAGMD